jgi:hypothetical protein
MDVHASPEELPELKEFLGSFQVRFRRPEGAEALERYTTGLLTELPPKNCNTMAQAAPGTSAQRLQEFLTNMQRDDAELNRQRVQKMMAEIALGMGWWTGAFRSRARPWWEWPDSTRGPWARWGTVQSR